MQETVTNSETIELKKVPAVIWEFYDTITKIKRMVNVEKVCFVKELTDIYVVINEDNIELENNIISKFAQWEAAYRLFPELHVLTKEDNCYIPSGVVAI